MHATMAYVNGAGSLGRAGNRIQAQRMQLLHALLCGAKAPDRTSVDREKSRDERQAEEESAAETVSRPGSFKNDPDQSNNPNEVRERHLEKVNR